jgi:hypothetical protein
MERSSRSRIAPEALASEKRRYYQKRIIVSSNLTRLFILITNR